MTGRVQPRRADEALVIVDVQNDFCDRGALAIAHADEIVEPINRLAREFSLVVATRDWHPPDHRSFVTQGGPWPVHCVRGTAGAELHPQLERGAINEVVDKGQAPALDGYSAFENTALEAFLRTHGIRRLHVAGLALDYCVKHTTLDAIRLGFAVVVHRDATRAVAAEDGDRTLEELAAAGAQLAR